MLLLTTAYARAENSADGSPHYAKFMTVRLVRSFHDLTLSQILSAIGTSTGVNFMGDNWLGRRPLSIDVDGPLWKDLDRITTKFGCVWKVLPGSRLIILRQAYLDKGSNLNLTSQYCPQLNPPEIERMVKNMADSVDAVARSLTPDAQRQVVLQALALLSPSKRKQMRVGFGVQLNQMPSAASTLFEQVMISRLLGNVRFHLSRVLYALEHRSLWEVKWTGVNSSTSSTLYPAFKCNIPGESPLRF
jgi:hypothetical protein